MIRPLGIRIVLRPLPKSDQTVRGIYIPNTGDEAFAAEVVAAGPGRLSPDGVRIPNTVKVGDRVLVGKWDLTNITVEDEAFLVATEDSIIAFID